MPRPKNVKAHEDFITVLSLLTLRKTKQALPEVMLLLLMELEDVLISHTTIDLLNFRSQVMVLFNRYLGVNQKNDPQRLTVDNLFTSLLGAFKVSLKMLRDANEIPLDELYHEVQLTRFIKMLFDHHLEKVSQVLLNHIELKKSHYNLRRTDIFLQNEAPLKQAIERLKTSTATIDEENLFFDMIEQIPPSEYQAIKFSIEILQLIHRNALLKEKQLIACERRFLRALAWDCALWCEEEEVDHLLSQSLEYAKCLEQTEHCLQTMTDFETLLSQFGKSTVKTPQDDDENPPGILTSFNRMSLNEKQDPSHKQRTRVRRRVRKKVH
ncbi:MAG: hypothetical protein JSR17_12200 [Proteobacteria bacterium]|nr:hypothetical protein [Pseudomonadota bacterium]